MPKKRIKPIPRKKQIGTVVGKGMLRVSIEEFGSMKLPRPRTIHSGGLKVIEGKGRWVDPIVKDRRKKEGTIKDRKKKK